MTLSVGVFFSFESYLHMHRETNTIYNVSVSPLLYLRSKTTFPIMCRVYIRNSMTIEIWSRHLISNKKTTSRFVIMDTSLGNLQSHAKYFEELVTFSKTPPRIYIWFAVLIVFSLPKCIRDMHTIYKLNQRHTLTHLPLVSHICVSESGQHWFT